MRIIRPVIVSLLVGLMVFALNGTAMAAGAVRYQGLTSAVVNFELTNGQKGTLRIGQMQAGVRRITSVTRPFYAIAGNGGGRICLKAGTWFYPSTNDAAVEPTIRC